MQTRRNFLAQSSLIAAGLGLGIRPLHAISEHQWRSPASRLFPEPIDPGIFSPLAERTIQVAKDAGASYADIRLGEAQRLFMVMGLSGVEAFLAISASKGYGIRVLVDGIWGFASGVTVTPEYLAQAAREAVTHARNQAKAFVAAERRHVDLASIPVARGTWRSPLEIDPFTVSLQAHREQLGAQCGAIARVLGVSSMSEATGSWQKEVRVFASSEGALVHQHAIRSLPSVRIGFISMPNYGFMTGGFETISSVALIDKIKAFADNVVRMQSFPLEDMDVGRYPVVMTGECAAPLAHVLSQACEADRALGAEADTAGSSFLAPYDDVMAAQAPQFSPHVNLRVMADEHSMAYWHWDGEGTKSEEYPLITNGKVVHYSATRESAGLAGTPPGFMVRGNALVSEVDRIPVNAPADVMLSLSVSPGAPAPAATVEDLVRDVPDGLLLWGGGTGAMPDPGLATIFYSGHTWRVKGGKIVAQAPGAALLLRTPKLWKDSVAAFGGSATTQRAYAMGMKGMPWQSYPQMVSAPAIQFNDVDVIRRSGAVR